MEKPEGTTIIRKDDQQTQVDSEGKTDMRSPWAGVGVGRCLSVPAGTAAKDTTIWSQLRRPARQAGGSGYSGSNWVCSPSMKGRLHLATGNKVTASITQAKPNKGPWETRKNPPQQWPRRWHLGLPLALFSSSRKGVSLFCTKCELCLGAFRLRLCQRSVRPLYF